MAVKPIPDGYQSAIPYLSIGGAAEAIEFYKRAFGATLGTCMKQPDGRIGHAEIRIGGSMVMLADEFPEMGFKSPKTLGGSPVMLHLYVTNVEEIAQQAAAAGANIVRPVSDQFYGDRTVGIEDPFGHSWYFATHVEDVSHEEMARRHKELAAKQNC